MNYNIVAASGGVGATTLAVTMALLTEGMVIDRTQTRDAASMLAIPHDPTDGVFVHRFGDGPSIADCGRHKPAELAGWGTILVASRRYGPLHNILHGGWLDSDVYAPIVGWVDVSTGSDVLSLSDMRHALGRPHLGTMHHSTAVARVIDAGLLLTRLPHRLRDEVGQIVDTLEGT